MKSKTNIDIRSAMKCAGLTYKRMAEIMSVSEATLYRLLQSDLGEQERTNLIRIINTYEAGKNAAKLRSSSCRESTDCDPRKSVIEMSDHELYEELRAHRGDIVQSDRLKAIANEYRNRIRNKTKYEGTR